MRYLVSVLVLFLSFAAVADPAPLPAMEGSMASPNPPASLEEHAKAVRLLIDHHYKDTVVLSKDRKYYTKEALLDLSHRIFSRLDDKSIGPNHPLRSEWVATITANLMAQSRFRPDALSGHNWVDADGDGKKELVKCSWKHFDERCDYGEPQLNGTTIRRLWSLAFGGERFVWRKHLHRVMDRAVAIPIIQLFLHRQKEVTALACDKSIRRAGALRKARCGKYLRLVPRLLEIETEREVKRHPLECRRQEGCESVCQCEVVRRGTGGIPGDLDTGLSTRMGGTVTAWWIQKYYQAVHLVRTAGVDPFMAHQQQITLGTEP